MKHTLFPETTLDFGPSAFVPEGERAPLHQVAGRKAAQLRSEVRRLCPRKPGVYAMVDGQGEVLYIGKAKNLRARLLSYFRPRSRGPRGGRILRHTSSIAWEVNPSEFAALLRELELIRRWRPRGNVQGQPLRRRLAFVCLGGSPAPYVYLSRRPWVKVLARFGPVPAGPRAAEAVRRVNDVWQLRDCPAPQEMVFTDDAELFPGPRTAGCLRHEIGACLGPCAAACARTEYTRRVQAVRAFLEGTDGAMLTALEQDMTAAAAVQAFERAAVLRDRLEALRWLWDKLAHLLLVLEKYSFINPIRGTNGRMWWYLIHRGRTVTVFPEPQTADQRRSAAKKLREVYWQEARTLDSHEHLDGMLVVTSWFRRHPCEKRKTLAPAEALRRCDGTNFLDVEPAV